MADCPSVKWPEQTKQQPVDVMMRHGANHILKPGSRPYPSKCCSFDIKLNNRFPDRFGRCGGARSEERQLQGGQYTDIDRCISILTVGYRDRHRVPVWQRHIRGDGLTGSNGLKIRFTRMCWKHHVTVRNRRSKQPGSKRRKRICKQEKIAVVSRQICRKHLCSGPNLSGSDSAPMSTKQWSRCRQGSQAVQKTDAHSGSSAWRRTRMRTTYSIANRHPAAR